MKRLLFIITLGLLLFAACKKDDTKPKYVCTECSGLFSERLNMWVDNKLTRNPDNPDEFCLKVQFNKYESDTSWTPFCQDICGFDYQPGYVYELYIERKKIGKDDQGEPIYKYCLLYIKEQRPEPMK